MGLIMIAKCPSVIIIRKLNKGLLFIRYRNYMTHLEPYSKVKGKERDPGIWGSAFIGVKGRGLGFHGFTPYW